MTAWRVSLVLLGAVANLSPAAASQPSPPGIVVTHDAPVPCGPACATWYVAEGGVPDKCAIPFPPGSHDESVYRVTDPQRGVLVETIPVMDYDSYICTDTNPRRLVAALTQGLAYVCSGGPIPGVEVPGWSCAEGAGLSLSSLHAVNGGANDRFVVISYNVTDAYPLRVELHGAVELVDDSFEAVRV